MPNLFRELIKRKKQFLAELPKFEYNILETSQTSSFPQMATTSVTTPKTVNVTFVNTITKETIRKDMVNLGSFYYHLDAATQVEGLNHISAVPGLYMQISPNRKYEKDAQKIYDAEVNRGIRSGKESKAEYTSAIESIILEQTDMIQYRNLAFGSVHKAHRDEEVNYLVLGSHSASPDGINYDNAAAYKSDWQKVSTQGNIHEFVIPSHKTQGHNVRIYHANVQSNKANGLQSQDLDKLYQIYERTIQQGKPLVIHCTDGLDRAGSFTFAVMLLHHFDNIFQDNDPNQVNKRILELLNQLRNDRSPMCCSNLEALPAAIELAFALRAVQLHHELMHTLSVFEPRVYQTLAQSPNMTTAIAKIDAFIVDPAIDNTAKDNLTALRETLVCRRQVEFDYFSRTKHNFVQVAPLLDEKMVDIENSFTSKSKKDKAYTLWNQLKVAHQEGIDITDMLDQQIKKLRKNSLVTFFTGKNTYLELLIQLRAIYVDQKIKEAINHTNQSPNILTTTSVQNPPEQNSSSQSVWVKASPQKTTISKLASHLLSGNEKLKKDTLSLPLPLKPKEELIKVNLEIQATHLSNERIKELREKINSINDASFEYTKECKFALDRLDIHYIKNYVDFDLLLNEDTQIDKIKFFITKKLAGLQETSSENNIMRNELVRCRDRVEAYERNPLDYFKKAVELMDEKDLVRVYNHLNSSRIDASISNDHDKVVYLDTKISLIEDKLLTSKHQDDSSLKI